MVVASIIVVASLTVGGYYYYKQSHQKKTSKDVAIKEEPATKETDLVRIIEEVGSTYTEANSVRFTSAATLYFNKSDYTNMQKVLDMIPDETASISVLSIKYKLMTDRYLTENNQEMYIKTRDKYKAILTSRQSKDSAAKTALKTFDADYPENRNPKVTYPEGEEVQ